LWTEYSSAGFRLCDSQIVVDATNAIDFPPLRREAREGSPPPKLPGVRVVNAFAGGRALAAAD
jgi:hypothetical protein